jgi:hypothetical protein
MHDPSPALLPTVPSASPRVRRRARLAGVAQLVEHLLCKQVVGGSSPPASSTSFRTSEGCPSGQREQAVNLPAHAYVGSNPTPSTCPVGFARPDRVALLPRGSRPFVVGSSGVRQASGASRPSLPSASPRRLRRFVVGVVSSGVDVDLVFQDSDVDLGAACAARSMYARRGARSAVDRKRIGRDSSSSFNFAGVAQLVERQPSKLNVEGSSPFSRSRNETGRSDVLDVSRQGVWADRRLGCEEVTAHLAQLVEHVLGKDEVTSSNLVVGSSTDGQGVDRTHPKGVGR